MKTLKNEPQKLLIIGPNLFFSPSPQPRIYFSYYKYLPRHICFLICDLLYLILVALALLPFDNFSNQKLKKVLAILFIKYPLSMSH